MQVREVVLASLAWFSDKFLIHKAFPSSVNFLGGVEDTLSEDTFWKTKPSGGFFRLGRFSRSDKSLIYKGAEK